MKKTFKSIDLSLISNLVLSILVIALGLIVMIFKSFGLIEIVLYISILFYIYALLSTISYFIKRKEGDYELLLQALINIIVATFMFIFKNDNPPMILGISVIIYTILISLNRGCKALLLKKQDSYMWIIKLIVTFLIAFLGLLTTFNLFKEVTVQTMMFGFYFMSLGFMLTIESTIEIFITDETFRKLLSKVLEDESKKNLEEIKEPKKVIKETAKNITEIKEEKEKKPKAVKKVSEKKEDKKEVQTKPKKETKNKSEIKVEENKKKVTKSKKEPVEIKKETKKPGRPKKTDK